MARLPKNAPHNKSRRWRCEVKGCGHTAATPSLLHRHMVTHPELGIAKIPCKDPDCTRMFTQKCNMENHFRSQHLKLRSAPCPVCGIVLSDNSNLRHHFVAIHENPTSKRQRPDRKRKSEKKPKLEADLINGTGSKNSLTSTNSERRLTDSPVETTTNTFAEDESNSNIEVYSNLSTSNNFPLREASSSQGHYHADLYPLPTPTIGLSRASSVSHEPLYFSRIPNHLVVPSQRITLPSIHSLLAQPFTPEAEQQSVLSPFFSYGTDDLGFPQFKFPPLQHASPRSETIHSQFPVSEPARRYKFIEKEEVVNFGKPRVLLLGSDITNKAQPPSRPPQYPPPLSPLLADYLPPPPPRSYYHHSLSNHTTSGRPSSRFKPFEFTSSPRREKAMSRCSVQEAGYPISYDRGSSMNSMEGD